jgi:tetratricopeptide (TPR) repeat protein
VSTLLIGFAILFLVFVAVYNGVIFYFFKKEKISHQEAQPILEEAQKIYADGKWSDSVSLLEKNMPFFLCGEDRAEANRILGWGYYYLGSKGITDKYLTLHKSKQSFEFALKLTRVDPKKKMSSMNGLPLALWILGVLDQGYREAALMIAKHATEIFPKEPSVWNTRSILLRWAKEFRESIGVCVNVYQTALAKKDYVMAGHGKQNQGDSYRELGLIEVAKMSYLLALNMYEKAELGGKTVTAHIQSVNKKLAALS